MPSQQSLRQATWIEIDSSTLVSNFLAIKNHLAIKSPLVKIFPVVKANAYGHGIIPCAQLYTSLGAEKLCVALLSEAGLLRTNPHLTLHTTPIIVLTPPLPEEAEQICQTNVEIVATDLSFLTHLNNVAIKNNKMIRIHLYIDTGMHRDGIAPQQALEFAKKCQQLTALELTGLCTHFSDSDNSNQELTQQQIALFDSTYQTLIQNGFKFSDVHAANSGAILQFPDSYFSAVRPGITLYGYLPSKNLADLKLKPALSLKTKVVSLRQVSSGDFIGYGTFYQVQQNTRIASIPIGYADGIGRNLSGKLNVLIQGKYYKNVGRICMDQLMIDVGEDDIKIGDEVVIIGHQIHADINAYELAQRGDTIPYEILTNLSSRIPRFFV